MPEKFSSKIDAPPPPNNPFESADYQGDFGELFLERIQNPVIKKQIVRLAQEGGDQTSPANIQRKINRGIQKAKELPKVVPGTGASGTARVFKDNVWPKVGRPLTPHELSLVVAHEKGHLVRHEVFFGKWFDAYFASGFDTSKVDFTEADYEFFMQENMRNAPPEMKEKYTPEVARQSFIGGVFNSAEITERMGQLKNYFGMKANETFTAEHLRVARERYLVDLPGCDNGMTQFFQAITSETEERFLYLVNNSGI